MTASVPLDPASVLWSAEPEERAGRPALVLLHGYGADERDLFGLVPYLPAEFVIAAPRAPLAPPAQRYALKEHLPTTMAAQSATQGQNFFTITVNAYSILLY